MTEDHNIPCIAKKFNEEFYERASAYMKTGFKHGCQWAAYAPLDQLLIVANYLHVWKRDPDDFNTLQRVFLEIEEHLDALGDPKLRLWDASQHAKAHISDPSTIILDGVKCVTTLGSYWFTGWAEACLLVLSYISPLRKNVDQDGLTYGVCVFDNDELNRLCSL